MFPYPIPASPFINIFHQGNPPKQASPIIQIHPIFHCLLMAIISDKPGPVSGLLIVMTVLTLYSHTVCHWQPQHLLINRSENTKPSSSLFSKNTFLTNKNHEGLKHLHSTCPHQFHALSPPHSQFPRISREINSNSRHNFNVYIFNH